MIGIESIGILEVGVDGRAAANLYIELKPAELVVDSLLTTSQTLNDVTDAVLEIGVDQVHNITMYEFETFPIIINVDEQSNRSASDIAVGALEITAEQTNFSRGYGVNDPAELIIFAQEFITSSISFITFAELEAGVQTYNAYYTFNIQEYEQRPIPLEMSGNSIDYYIPVSQGGGGPTEIPQIWIG